MSISSLMPSVEFRTRRENIPHQSMRMMPRPRPPLRHQRKLLIPTHHPPRHRRDCPRFSQPAVMEPSCPSNRLPVAGLSRLDQRSHRRAGLSEQMLGVGAGADAHGLSAPHAASTAAISSISATSLGESKPATSSIRLDDSRAAISRGYRLHALTMNAAILLPSQSPDA